MEDDANWINLSDEFKEYTHSQIYVTAFYFSVTTITTVGYGDISGNNTSERIICILLMIMGVIFFSINSGNITSIISSQEAIDHEVQRRKCVLSRIYR